ncbi:MAG: DUF2808 domain-containing protein [Coleofasciculaceae cyanobacterium]
MSNINIHRLSTNALVFSTLLSGSLFASVTPAIELANGQTAFESAPRLIRATSSFKSRNLPTATYHFTLQVPENAGEPLKAVKIEGRNNSEVIEFDVRKSRAFIGDSLAGGQALSVSSVSGTSKADEVTVVFDQPVSPGSTVTVALKLKRNPFNPGVYLFGVTAFPEGENGQGLYLGSGRIQIYH